MNYTPVVCSGINGVLSFSFRISWPIVCASRDPVSSPYKKVHPLFALSLPPTISSSHNLSERHPLLHLAQSSRLYVATMVKVPRTARPNTLSASQHELDDSSPLPSYAYSSPLAPVLCSNYTFPASHYHRRSRSQAASDLADGATPISDAVTP